MGQSLEYSIYKTTCVARTLNDYSYLDLDMLK